MVAEKISNGKDMPKSPAGMGETPIQDEKLHKKMEPKRYPIKPYLGILVIAKREFFANLKSVRMLVLMALFVLAVLGGAYGISGLSSSGQTLPEVNALAWVIVEDYEGTGALNDLVVMITDGEGNPRADAQVEYLKEEDSTDEVLFNSRTNQNGTVVINDVLQSLFDINENYFRVTLGNDVERVRTSYSLEGIPKNAYVMVHTLDLDDDNIEDDALILVLDGSGVPVVEASVNVSSSANSYYKTTDSKGLVALKNLKAGGMTFEGVNPRKYDIEATYTGTTSQNVFYIIRDDESVEGLFEFEGPNEIIYFISALFIVLLGPIIAISLSFDSINREKIQKSLDFLLCRPMGRRGIVTGKFIGILAAIILPVTAINLLAVGLIASVTEKNPSGPLVLGFVVYTIIFIAVYILLSQIFSTLAKTTGTAILSGIAIWLIFFMFWGLITLAIGAAMGMQLGSDAWIEMNNRMSLFNPSGAYSLAVGLLMPGQGSVLGLESWMPPVALVAWLFVMYVLATEIFVRKADS